MHWTQPEKQVPRLQDSCMKKVQLNEDPPECNSSQTANTTISLTEFRRGKTVATSVHMHVHVGAICVHVIC